VSSDALEELRVVARLDWPAEVALLVKTLTAEEWDRLGELLRDWPADRGPIPRGRVRMCLDVKR
jgi:hypothetical protein